MPAYLIAERHPGDFTLPGTITTSPDTHMATELMTSGRAMQKPAQQSGGPGTPGSWTMVDSMLNTYAGQANHDPLLDLRPCGPIQELGANDEVFVLCNSPQGTTARRVTPDA